MMTNILINLNDNCTKAVSETYMYVVCNVGFICEACFWMLDGKCVYGKNKKEQSCYVVIDDGALYFQHGKIRIRVSKCFAEQRLRPYFMVI